MIQPSFRATQKPRLGELMVQLGFLTQGQLEQSLTAARGTSLGRAFVQQGLCSEPQVMTALSRQVGLAPIDLDSRDLHLSAAIPQALARKVRAVVVERGPDLLVAIAAPASLDAQDAVRAVVGKSRLRFMLASDVQLDRALARLYPVATPPQPVPAAAAVEAPMDLIARLDLSPRTVDVVQRAAAELSITPREVIRRAMESWASTRRATSR